MKKVILITLVSAAAVGTFLALRIPQIDVFIRDYTNRKIKFRYQGKEYTYQAGTGMGLTIPGNIYWLDVSDQPSTGGKSLIKFMIRRGTKVVANYPLNELI